MAVDNDYRNYLIHHGILGQKWGIRRYQNADGSLTSNGKDRYSKKEKKKAKKESNKKNVKSMSDNELREAINRLNMERTYSSLTSSNTGKGRKAALNILKIAGETAAIVGSVSSIASIISSFNNAKKVTGVAKNVGKATTATQTIIRTAGEFKK